MLDCVEMMLSKLTDIDPSLTDTILHIVLSRRVEEVNPSLIQTITSQFAPQL